MALFNTANIAYTIVVVILLGMTIWFFLVWRKKVRSEKQLKESEQVLDKDEDKYKVLIGKKMRLLHELSSGLGRLMEIFDRKGLKEMKEECAVHEKRLKEIKDVLSEQLHLLKEMTSIDKKDLEYLKHMEVDIAGEKEKVHVSEFIGKLEEVWGKFDDSAARKQIYDRIMEDKDPIRQAVKLIAFNLIHVYFLFHELTGMIKGVKASKGQKKKEGQENVLDAVEKRFKELKAGKFRKGNNVESTVKAIREEHIPKLHSLVEDELYHFNLTVRHTETIRHHLAQLSRVEAARNIARGPFLTVENHPVDVVMRLEPREAKSFGKGEKIPLGNLPKDFPLGSDQDKCVIVLGHGAQEVHALVNRDGAKCYLTPYKDTPGVFIIRPSHGLLVVCLDTEDKKRMKALLDKSAAGYDIMYDDLKKHVLPGQKKESDMYTGKTVQLKEGDRIVLAFGYEFVFSAR
ncbi:MAG: hypothetical protein KKD17_06720 [Nanoarchaeota archaeon]|nr:hypothetical protein [Nanoarchaeota archaeon]